MIGLTNHEAGLMTFGEFIDRRNCWLIMHGTKESCKPKTQKAARFADLRELYKTRIIPETAF
jgi:hypothetical protein